LSRAESNTLRYTYNLVAADAPAWVLEMNEVVELLPYRIYEALPEPLQKGGFEANNSARVESAKALSSVEQIQALIAGVLDHQLRRLGRRWSAATVQVQLQNEHKGAKREFKGTEGLRRKVLDLSKYMHNLTEKQELAFSLRHQYGLKLAEVASRMGIDRKTAYEHIQAAAIKIDQARSHEKRKADRAKSTPEE
jgi:hypothetical protein